MKLALKLTLDGLLRALRVHAHRRVEEIEAGRLAAPAKRIAQRPPTADARGNARMTGHGRGRD